MELQLISTIFLPVETLIEAQFHTRAILANLTK